jgi:hypothetical protein
MPASNGNQVHRYDQLAAMRAFARVVEAGTFTRASGSLDMPKATVTKLIQTLEAHLRTRLLNRTTRRVTVTPDGAAYYERVVQLLADLDELDGSMALSQASPKGRLRVDVAAIRISSSISGSPIGRSIWSRRMSIASSVAARFPISRLSRGGSAKSRF